MKRIISAILIALILVPSQALADGIIVPPEPPWDPIDENQQLATINYQNGLERMIIAVNFDMQNVEKAVWILPVPAEPEKVVIDIVTQFPRFYGTDVIEKAKSSINDVITASTLTQIYPIFFWFFRAGYYGVMTATEAIEMGRAAEALEGVTVHEHLEKEGITTEIITAENAYALYDYLQTQDLDIQQGTLPVLESYAGQEYTFVISWISSPEQFTQDYEIYPYRRYHPYSRQPGISITFPTDKIFYPLLPTSVYGSKTVPVRIYVLGHVTPELTDELRSYASTNYYVQSYLNVYPLESFFHGIDRNNAPYTKVEINAPSKYFTADLWFSPSAPLKVGYASMLYSGFNTHPIITGIVMILAISALTGSVAGFILFRDPKKYALIGLANLFSIIGLSIAIFLTRTRKVDEKLKKQIEEAGLIAITVDPRKFYFVVLFSILFLIFGLAVGYLIKLPLIV